MSENQGTGSPTTEKATFKMGVEGVPSDVLARYLTDMYESPLESAMREIVSNAIDACGGEEKLVEGDIRAWLGPCESDGRIWFHVLDCGRGMDSEELMEAFCRYGASGKDRDDGMIGSFGLGAKSPLAFSDELQVITMRDGEALFLSAYRTPDDEFVADVPKALSENGGMAIERRRDKASGRILCNDNKNTETEDASFATSFPFKPGTQSGTLVRFPVGYGYGGYRRSDNDSIQKAEGALEAISRVLFGGGAPDISSISGEGLEEPDRFFVAGKVELPSANGEKCKARLLLAASCATAWSSGRLGALMTALEPVAAGECDDIDELSRERCKKLMELTAFKVGSWLYPVSGAHWLGANDSGAASDYAFLIEVPSWALDFLPSREALAGGGNESVQDMFATAVKALAKFMQFPSTCARLVNWAAAREKNSYFREGFQTRISTVFSNLPLYVDENKMRCGAYEIDIKALTAYAGLSLEEALTSPQLVFGVVKKVRGGEVKDTGPIIAPASTAGKLTAGRHPITAESCDDGRAYRSPGFGEAQRKGFLRELLADGPGGLDREALQYKSQTNKAAMEDAYGEDSKAGDVLIPCALALWQMPVSTGKKLLIIDVPRDCIRGLSKGIEAIAAEMLQGTSEGAKISYALVPNWLEGIDARSAAGYIAPLISGDVRAVGADELRVAMGDAAKARSGELAAAERRKQEKKALEKAFSDADFYRVVGYPAPGSICHPYKVPSLVAQTEQRGVKTKESIAEKAPSTALVSMDAGLLGWEPAALDIASFAMATDKWDAGIEKIAVVPARSLSKKKLATWIELGGKIVYDGSGRADECSMLRSDEVVAEPGRKDAGEGDDGRLARLSYKGKLSDDMEMWLEGVAVREEALALQAVIFERIPHLGAIGAGAFDASAWAQILSLGHETYDFQDGKEKVLPYWKTVLLGSLDLYRRVECDTETFDAKAGPCGMSPLLRAEALSAIGRIAAAAEIWRVKMKSSDLHVDVASWEDTAEAAEKMGAIARILGIESAIAALYKGISLEDVVRGEPVPIMKVPKVELPFGE